MPKSYGNLTTGEARDEHIEHPQRVLLQSNCKKNPIANSYHSKDDKIKTCFSPIINYIFFTFGYIRIFESVKKKLKKLPKLVLILFDQTNITTTSAFTPTPGQ